MGVWPTLINLLKLTETDTLTVSNTVEQFYPSPVQESHSGVKPVINLSLNNCPNRRESELTIFNSSDRFLLESSLSSYVNSQNCPGLFLFWTTFTDLRHVPNNAEVALCPSLSQRTDNNDRKTLREEHR